MSTILDIETLICNNESNIFLSLKPDTPNIICVLYDTGGEDSKHSFLDIEYNNPSFQVYIRDDIYENGYSRCEFISNILDGLTSQTINSKNYISIFQRGDILALGQDDKNRYEFTINFYCKVKKNN